MNSLGTSFSGAINAGTVNLLNTSGTIAFNGALNATTLNTAAQAYTVALNAGGAFTNAVTFSNTAGVSLDGTTAFTGGLTSTASSTSLNGTIYTSGNAINLGTLALAGTSVIDTTNNGGNAAGANINISGTVNGADALTLRAGSNGGINFGSAVGGATALASISASANTINALSVNTTGSQSYTGSTSTSLNGSYITSGSAFTVIGSALLNGATNVDTTNGGLSANGGAISFGSINNGYALSLTAGTTAAINAGTASNVSLGAIGASSALGSLTIETGNAAGLILPSITLATGSNLSVTTNGAITQSGAIIVPGTASFTASGNAIDLATNGTGNSFTGGVSLSNSGSNNVSIYNNNALVLANTSVGGNFAVTTTGAISQLNAINVTGTASFNAGSNAIDLASNGANNSFTGAVSLSNSGDHNVTLNNSTALVLGNENVGANLSLTANASITQTGVISAALLTTNSVGGTILNGANTVTGFNATNATSGDIDLINANTLNVTALLKVAALEMYQ